MSFRSGERKRETAKTNCLRFIHFFSGNCRMVSLTTGGKSGSQICSPCLWFPCNQRNPLFSTKSESWVATKRVLATKRDFWPPFKGRAEVAVAAARALPPPPEQYNKSRPALPVSFRPVKLPRQSKLPLRSPFFLFSFWVVLQQRRKHITDFSFFPLHPGQK